MSVDLDVPADIVTDDNMHEVARVWIADDSVVTLRDIFGADIENWGMVLADVAVHVARMKLQHDDVSLETTLARIEDGYRGRLANYHDLDHRSLMVRN